MKEKSDVRSTCPHCGQEECSGPVSISLDIKKGHVRRASQAADGVYAAARPPESAADGEVEGGVVFMTAVLLVERLASAANCSPCSVLEKISRCFKIRDEHLRSPRNNN